MVGAEGNVARILLAEDDAATRSMVARALAGDGHGVTEAEDGQAALAVLLANPAAIDVLVTDVEMPGLDGIELAKTALAARPSLKVLLITGHAGGLSRAEGLAAPGVRSLSKPATLEKVRAEVKALLG